MPRIVSTDDSLVLATDALTLAFRRDGQRWSHDLALASRPLASSVEWEPGRDDPARVVSPAYQQLSHQQSPDGPQALLVGQWGPHHFSAVFTLREAPGSSRVEVDVAVRTRAELRNLASTYVLALTSGDLLDAAPSALLWSLHDPLPGRLAFSPDASPSRVNLAEAGRARTTIQVEAPVLPGTSTQRLRYHWEWLDAPLSRASHHSPSPSRNDHGGSP